MRNKIYFNLNFDDFHPQDDNLGDFGGINGDIFNKLNLLLDRFPSLKITMFTSPNWTDAPFIFSKYFYYLKYGANFFPVVKELKDEPFNLLKHPDWCNWVKEKVVNKRIEIAVHGYKHYNPKRVIHGQEFFGINEKETKEKILASEKLFREAGIFFVKGFRPPGWGMSNSLIGVLVDLNYKFIAPFPSSYKLSKVGNLEGLKVIPQNYSILEPTEEGMMQAEKNGLVFAKGHLAYYYGREVISNGLNDNNFNNIVSLISQLEEKYEVEYVSIMDYLNKFN